MFQAFLNLLFPPRCVLCRAFLSSQETDLCTHCRQNAPEFTESHIRFSFVAGWTALWYYKDNVRGSMHRYKFRGARSHRCAYGRLLAMKLQKEGWCTYDVLTFVPVSFLRKLIRGYDQVELLADMVGAELETPYVHTLRKRRHTPPQSGIVDPYRRKANVLGAYAPIDPDKIRGKRILLLDDVITTGATASECARVLLTAGAKEVFCAAVAAREHKTK